MFAGFSWQRFFIWFRNRIGDMEYDDYGATGYATSGWRVTIARVFDTIAYRPPTLLWRMFLLHLGIIQLEPCSECGKRGYDCVCAPF